MANKESGIQRLILDYLKSQRYYVWRNYVGPILHGGSGKQVFSKNPASGMPDIMGLLKDGSGRLFAIEVKTETGRLSELQKIRIAELKKHGVIAFVARDLQTVVRELMQANET